MPRDLTVAGDAAVSLTTAGEVRRLPADGAPQSLFEAPGARAVASLGADALLLGHADRIEVRSAAGDLLFRTADFASRVEDLIGVARDRFASAHLDGSVRIWSRSGQLLSTSRVHTRRAVTLATDGDTLWSGGWDARIVRHDLRALDVDPDALRSQVEDAFGVTAADL